MSDSDVQITAGSGTKIDTRTVGPSTDEHRQVMCIGDPNTAANVMIVDATGGSYTSGTVASGSADSGNPVKVGARAENSLATATMVADGNRVDNIADLDGSLMVKPLVPFGDIIVTRVTDTGGTSTAFSAFPATVGARNYITSITVYNSSTTNGFLDIRDGTAGSVIYTIPLPGLGGATIPFLVPLRQPTANTALAYDVSAALSTVYISAVGFQSKV